MSRKRIGEILLERGAITTAQLEAGLKAQRQTQQRLGATLVGQGAITEPMLVQALSEALEIPVVNLLTVTPDWAAVHLVRARFCEQHEMFPYALENVGGKRRLVVAMTDPLNQSAIEEIEFTTGLKASPRVAALSAVRAAIMRYYHKVTPGSPAGGSRPAAATARPPASRGASQRPAPPPPEDDDEEVIVGEEVGPGENTARTSLAELIRTREQQRRQRRGQGEGKSRSSSGSSSAVLDDLADLFGEMREEPDRVEELERKFWALMRIMARKGLLSNEEFTRELDDTGEKKG